MKPINRIPFTVNPDQHRILIAAVDAASGIAKDGNMPWKLPEDMKHFKETTLGHPVIMGRKTFDTIGKPLPGRETIVITSDPCLFMRKAEEAGCGRWEDQLTAMASIDEALEYVFDKPTVFIAGGLSIYEQAIKYCNEMIITTIKDDFDCDQILVVQMDKWRTSSWKHGHSTNGGLEYIITTFERVAADDEPTKEQEHVSENEEHRKYTNCDEDS